MIDHPEITQRLFAKVNRGLMRTRRPEPRRGILRAPDFLRVRMTGAPATDALARPAVSAMSDASMWRMSGDLTSQKVA
jgi:hypothetical protein